jgi:hypothetical protein
VLLPERRRHGRRHADRLAPCIAMASYQVKIPPGLRLAGHTAAGQPAIIPPGEHHVHRLRLSARPSRWGTKDVLRFVGADFRGRDVHVPIPPGADIRDVLAVDLMPLNEQREA